MLCFFLWYPLSAFAFRTAIEGFTDEIVLAVPLITCVLVVPSMQAYGFESGGLPYKALLL
jgi:hypothetical protein